MPENAKKMRTFLLISNIVIAVLCVVAMAGYFIIPAGQVRLSVKIDKNYLTALKNDIPGSGSSSAGSSSGGSSSAGKDGSVYQEELDAMFGDALNGIDRNAIVEFVLDTLIEKLGNKSLTLSVSAAVSTPDLISTIGVPDREAARILIMNNIDGLTDELIAQLDNTAQLLTETADAVIRKFLSETIRSSFVEIEKIVAEISGNGSTIEFDDFLERTGLDEEYVETEFSSIIDALSGEGMTADEIADRAADIYEEMYEKAGSDPRYGADILDKYEYDKEEFRSGIKDLLSEAGLQDENGKINLEQLIDQALINGLSQLLSTDAGSEEIPEDFSGMFTFDMPARASIFNTEISSAATTSAAPGRIANNQEVRENLRKGLVELAEKVVEDPSAADAFKAMHIALIILAAIVIIHILAWLYLFIKILAKLGRPNPGVTLWVPIVFGWSIFSLITLIPYIRLNFGKLSRLFGAGADQASAAIPDMLLRIATSGVLAALCGISLFIFAFFYSHYRRKLKQELANGGMIQ